MNPNNKRHLVLKILSSQFIACEIGKENILGVKYETIYKFTKCTNEELTELSSVLYENKEIGYHDASGVIGIFATEKGVAAYSDNKYLKIARKECVEKIKDFIQIIIPLLSLLVAVGAIYFKTESSNKSNEERFRKLEQKVDSLEKKLSDLQIKVSTYRAK